MKPPSRLNKKSVIMSKHTFKGEDGRSCNKWDPTCFEFGARVAAAESHADSPDAIHLDSSGGPKDLAGQSGGLQRPTRGPLKAILCYERAFKGNPVLREGF